MLQGVLFGRRRRNLDALQWLFGSARTAPAARQRQVRAGSQRNDSHDGKRTDAPIDRRPKLRHRRFDPVFRWYPRGLGLLDIEPVGPHNRTGQPSRNRAR
jgi:hypothetical protein